MNRGCRIAVSGFAILFLLPISIGSRAFADGPHTDPIRPPADSKCVDADKDPPCKDPGQFLSEFLTVVNRNRGRSVSDVLRDLSFQRGVVMGAEKSHSLQQSQGIDDPRLHLKTRCGSITVNLSGNSIEMNLVGQTADSALEIPGPTGTPKGPGNFSVGGGRGRFNTAPGEILVDLVLPRTSGDFTAADIVNRLDPDFPRDARTRSARVGERMVFHDTHRCSRCHVDTATGGTGGSMGVRELVVGGERIRAIVSPWFRERGTDAHDQTLCVPGDLRLLYGCACQRSIDPRCRHFPGTPWAAGAQIDERCARLRVVLALAPRQHCSFRAGVEGCFRNRAPPDPE